ncbi:hypothetical protein G5I_13240 [Acromyrmex echinatior]|uniref:Uncharacterized protein n=1 Tax=Acromyrmex echinatior TaxID=103372 RepID=F4X4H9_ACREC|nr:hypothetical protein G5I_13240 [Acromyrmex echinatior]
MMSVNKIGMSMRGNDVEKSRSSIESLRNYVHDSELCLNPDHYDAKERKIEHVAAPEFDTDVEVHSDVEKLRRNVEKNVMRMSDEIQHLNRDITIRIKNVVTNETLEKSFKTTGRDTIVRALQDTQKDILNDVEKVRNNVEEVSKGVYALSMRVSNEIQRGITASTNE